MTRRSCGGDALRAAFRAGVANLEAHVDDVNAMNVFPVPDGDTGSNMLATVRAALAEAEREAHTDAGPTAAAIGRGALFGAQGNSGVIASQVARGVAEALAGIRRVGGQDVARALAHGADTAYAAVADPVEGTMLTVIRDAADAAQAVVDVRDDPVAVLRAAVEAAEASVARTPDLLSVLREAGVADAGGEGIYLLLAGALASVDGTTPGRRRIVATERSRIPESATESFGFETLFRLEAVPGTPLDIAAIRRHLAALGESVVVAGDDRSATVHVHGAAPDEVLAWAAGLGRLSGIRVEDLDLKAGEASPELATGSTDAAASQAAPGLSVVAVVAVVAGAGFATLFGSLGASVVRTDGLAGGLMPNALCDAIAAAAARDVVILTTDKKGEAAAGQSEGLGDRRIRLVAARNAAEASAAMLAFDGTREVGAVVESMTSAMDRVQSFEVGAGSERDVLGASVAGLDDLEPGFELVTIYSGAAVDRRAAEDLGRSIAERLPDVEVEIVVGGQPESLYLIAAE